MWHILTSEDLEQLETKSALPESYVNVVRAYFHDLMEASTEEMSPGECSLDSGPIVVLEAGDGHAALSPILRSMPEYSEIVPMQVGQSAWKIVVMEDNDWFVTYFAAVGLHAAIDAWALPHLVSGPMNSTDSE